jgi:ABC-2 type transport system ATP-binding protein
MTRIAVFLKGISCGSMGPMSYAIETHDLVRIFGDNRAVDGVDLRVPSGGVYGVLGPNGAGKPTSGTALVLGHDVVAEAGVVRSKVAMTGQFASLDEDLTGTENLVMLARLYGFSWGQARQRSSELLDAFDLTDAADRQVKKYSGGMRRRIDIAGSIVVRPDLMFLDEPTTGLDPRSRNQVWDIVRALVSAGTTVLLTTQYLDEADQLADRIAVIDRGRVIAEGTSGELKASVGSGALHVRVADAAQRDEAVRVLESTLGTEAVREGDPCAISMRVEDPVGVPAALARLRDHGVATTEFSLGQPSLDEVFLALTGEAVHEEVNA